MIYEYRSSEYNFLIKNFKEFLSRQSLEIENNNSLSELVKPISIAIHGTNTDILENFDNLDLLFHRWSEIYPAYQNNILSEENTDILKLFKNEYSNKSSRDIIEAMFLILYSDIYQASLLVSDNIIYNTLINLLDGFENALHHLSKSKSRKLLYIWSSIPRDVFTNKFNYYFNKDVLNTVRDIKRNEKYIESLYEKNIKLKKDIEEIQKSLETQKSEYNFVGLSKGFITLKKSKVEELKSETSSYRALIFLILLLVVVKYIFIFKFTAIDNYSQTTLVIISLSTLFMFLIILYFFRISLSNIKSLKSQILQIDLRLTLCQFIHNYNTDTTELRDKDMKDSLDKFESVIFAPIMPSEDKIPATFDGLDNILKIISEIKNKV